MVFHNIESISDVLSGQRIIIYYIEGKLSGIKRNDIKLCKKALETALEMLEKKNDDLLIIQVLHGSEQFIHFDELYKPDVTGAATLFVVNNEGIPLLCEQINHADSVPNVIESLIINCKLNRIHRIDVSKTTQNDIESVSHLMSDSKEVGTTVNNSKQTFSESLPKVVTATTVGHESINSEELASIPTTSQVTVTDETVPNQITQPMSTELRIVLPNGDKVIQKFDRDASLQEVWVYISVTYHNLKDFDLKTFNRQVFSQEEYTKTLQSLALYPNGVIFVVVKNVVPFNNNSISMLIYNGLHSVMARTTSVFHYVQGLLFWVWNSFFPNNGSNGNTRSGRQSRPLQGGSNQSSSQKGSKKSASRPLGNVHTLRRNDDSDDENNRYNGNSTQQK
ncbi:UBX domain-containing protein 4 [Homalodisca vitripennis]|nr:UBX domain-containing protein 4 [Homalodisca vitripennis]